MSIEEILKEVLEKLERNNIEYMITGSLASNIHGVPRTTFDADIVISANFENLKKFIDEIKNSFYVDLDMVRDAFERKSIFNLIHYETGFKIDFIVKKQGAHFDMEFERRRAYTFAGRKCFFASPEDTILSKLLWAKIGESEKQFRDALGVAKIQAENLDFEYLQKSAENLGIKDMLEKLIEQLRRANLG
ncbi:hypothetical protein [Pseudothermotoga thermarum]|uniref:Uncharacterized protein n=1 Tax=Pseudothermotoga thermarum DSM 5069 TaxID=688269 RepID=F7YVR5_9THEM|nr:hypothetical protein [Pseudothermotoga thermarum]AEH51732.1 hypothetical protein Theth_1685 [Pseudothermotoga thermarum DSM 5069]